MILKLSLHFFSIFYVFFLLFTMFFLSKKHFGVIPCPLGTIVQKRQFFIHSVVAASFLADFLLNSGISLFFSSSFDIIRVRDETKVSKSNGKMCALLDTLWRLWVLIAQTCVFKTEFLWGCKKGILSPSDLQVFLALSPCPSFFYKMF